MSISTLRTQDGIHFLTAELDGAVNATRTELELGAWQDWDVLPDPFGESGVRVLKSCHGLYLSAYRPEYCVEIGVPQFTVAATAPAPDIWERWRVAIDGDIVRLQSCDSGLWLSPQQIDTAHPQAGGAGVLCNGPEPAGWETFFPSDMSVFGVSGGGGGGVVKVLQGEIRQQGHSFADASGPRIVHGCSDFAALAKYHEDRDTYLRNLDVAAQYQQYTRLGWRLNGWKFLERNLDVDPIRDTWWESALRGVLQAHQDRGMKVNLSSFDMNNWSDAQAMVWFRRTAEVAASFPSDLVWLSAVTNEMQGTWAPGETPEHVVRGRELMEAWVSIFPHGMQAISDPDNRSKDGMKKLGWTCALIHQHDGNEGVPGLIRRTFNDMYENYPGMPVVADEPRGPNGPGGGDVTASIEDFNDIFAVYTTQILGGEASTYFNSPGCAEREPLDSTWGFKELPQLWREMEIPEDIGQGTLGAGHTGEGMMLVKGSHASRADGTTRGSYNLGAISGKHDGEPWAVRANRTGQWSTWYADGKAWEGHLSVGQVIHTPRGFTPAVVRCIT